MKKYHVIMYGNGGVLGSQFVKAECVEDAVEMVVHYVTDYLGYEFDAIEEIRANWR